MNVVELRKIVITEDEDKLEEFIGAYQTAQVRGEALEDFFNIPLPVEGLSCLELAILQDKAWLMDQLVKAGASLDRIGKNGFKPIHFATVEGKINALKYLLGQRVDVNTRQAFTNYTPLMLAAIHNRKKIIPILHAEKAELNYFDVKGNTAVGLATIHQHFEALFALMNTGANPDLADGVAIPPIIIAADIGFEQALSLFITKCANVNVRHGCQLTGVTALFVAVQRQFVASVKLILATDKAELNFIYTEHGVTAILKAALVRNEIIFALLFERGADIHLLANPNNLHATEKKDTVLHPLTTMRTILLRKYRVDGFPVALKNMLKIIDTRKLVFSNAFNFSYNENADHKLSNCSYGEDGVSVTHVFGRKLGEGCFGHVNVMKPVLAGGLMLAVKELKPFITKFQDATTDEMLAILDDARASIIIEAETNYAMHGVGACFYLDKPIVTHEENGLIVLDSYPKYYIATKYISGSPLGMLDIKRADQYFLIFIDVLKKLKKMHQTLIHGDVNEGNILVKEISAYRYNTTLIDFSFSRPAGTIFDTTFMHPTVDKNPPEFKHRFVKMAANQDIYRLGLFLKKSYHKCHFPPGVTRDVSMLFEAMLNLDDPQARPSVDDVLSSLQLTFAKKLSTQYQYMDLLVTALTRVDLSVEDKNDFILMLGREYFVGMIKSEQDFLAIFNVLEGVNRTTFISLLGEQCLQWFPVQNALFSDPETAVYLFNLVNDNDGYWRLNYLVKDALLAQIKVDGIDKVLLQCDKFEKSHPSVYRQLILVVNQIYRELRTLEPAEYLSVWGKFFGYSKEDKIKASLQLETQFGQARNGVAFFREGVHKQGQLGEITRRLGVR